MFKTVGETVRFPKNLWRDEISVDEFSPSRLSDHPFFPLLFPSPLPRCCSLIKLRSKHKKKSGNRVAIFFFVFFLQALSRKVGFPIPSFHPYQETALLYEGGIQSRPHPVSLFRSGPKRRLRLRRQNLGKKCEVRHSPHWKTFAQEEIYVFAIFQ